MLKRKNKHWIKYGVFILLVVLLIIGSVFLAKEINPYLEWLGKYGYLGVFLGALAANATVIFPAPFMGITFPLAIGLASQTDPFSVSVVYALGATLGEGTAYILGRGGKRILNKKESLLYQKAEKWLNKYGKWWAIMILSAQPIFPFDIVGIVAGVLRYSWWRFLIFCFLGRIPKYLIVIWGGFELWKIIS